MNLSDFYGKINYVREWNYLFLLGIYDRLLKKIIVQLLFGRPL